MKANGYAVEEAGGGFTGRCSKQKDCQVSVCCCVHNARCSQKTDIACHKGQREVSAALSCPSRGDVLGTEERELYASSWGEKSCTRDSERSGT